MKPEEFNAKIKQVMENLSDQAQVSTLLTELSDVYGTKIAETATATQTSQQLTADNEKLRQANMNLFLKVGETKTPEKAQTQDTTPQYADLFDEKGNLK